jgi:hypothetical protein
MPYQELGGGGKRVVGGVRIPGPRFHGVTGFWLLRGAAEDLCGGSFR